MRNREWAIAENAQKCKVGIAPRQRTQRGRYKWSFCKFTLFISTVYCQ